VTVRGLATEGTLLRLTLPKPWRPAAGSLKQQLRVMRAYADVCWCALAVPAAATAAADRVIVLPFDQPQSA
jgi:hypothetical protein